ncbi:MAG TPA: CocE/NonD family hydrolase [Steroidobacteraceae bacterium]|nr:CocE/NonD family hydrolase [Steroidobacteraceae bacterium]
MKDEAGFQLIMREGVPPDQVTGRRPPPPPVAEDARENNLHIFRNAEVRLRDGVRIFVDIYRPAGTARVQDLPVILGWSPYGKHNTRDQLPWPEADVGRGWISQYTAFEAPDPAFWCEHGFAVVYADPRGCWYSQGEQRHGGQGEAEDCFDLIHWLEQQPWCNGRVGMSGVSYLTAIQWQVAALRPAPLAAINPWEGFSDWYREFALHGGIPETSFVPRGCANLQWSTTRTEDTPANIAAHPLHDAYWRSKEVALEQITAPAWVVASWADQGLHTRGTLEGYRRIGSRQKWLEVHGRKKWHYYYRPDNLERQFQFFAHFLRHSSRIVPAWPRVRIEVRERANEGAIRSETAWPIADTQYQRLYLEAGTGYAGTLRAAPATGESTCRYDPLSVEGCAQFDYRFDADTETTGTMVLHAWVQALGADDMDLFVAIHKLDATGHFVPFIFYSMCEDGPVALGWLRVSHRALDAAQSRQDLPVHPHDREQPLAAGDIVPVDIEIWPSSTMFHAGETLRLVIKGRDTVQPSVPNAPFARHEHTRNRGLHVIHAGGRYDSYLQIPVIPPRPDRTPAQEPTA